MSVMSGTSAPLFGVWILELRKTSEHTEGATPGMREVAHPSHEPEKGSGWICRKKAQKSQKEGRGLQ